MQLPQCFPGCRLLPRQNKPGEDEGGAVGEEEGHHLTPLIASQADIPQRHSEARVQGTGQLWQRLSRGPCSSARLHPSSSSSEGMGHPGQAPLSGYGRDHAGPEGSRAFPGQTLIGALGAAQLLPGKFTNQEH